MWHHGAEAGVSIDRADKNFDAGEARPPQVFHDWGESRRPVEFSSPTNGEHGTPADVGRVRLIAVFPEVEGWLCANPSVETLRLGGILGGARREGRSIAGSNGEIHRGWFGLMAR